MLRLPADPATGPEDLRRAREGRPRSDRVRRGARARRSRVGRHPAELAADRGGPHCSCDGSTELCAARSTAPVSIPVAMQRRLPGGRPSGSGAERAERAAARQSVSTRSIDLRAAAPRRRTRQSRNGGPRRTGLVGRRSLAAASPPCPADPFPTNPANCVSVIAVLRECGGQPVGRSGMRECVA